MSMEHLYWDEGQDSDSASFTEVLIKGRVPKADQRPPYRTDTEDFSETISPPSLFADTNENNNGELFTNKDSVPWPQEPKTSCYPLTEALAGPNNYVILCGNCACSVQGRIITMPRDD